MISFVAGLIVGGALTWVMASLLTGRVLRRQGGKEVSCSPHLMCEIDSYAWTPTGREEQAFIRAHIGAPKAFLFLAGIGILWPLRLFAKRDKRRISFGQWHSNSRHKRSVSIYTKDGALIAQFGRTR